MERWWFTSGESSSFILVSSVIVKSALCLFFKFELFRLRNLIYSFKLKPDEMFRSS